MEIISDSTEALLVSVDEEGGPLLIDL